MNKRNPFSDSGVANKHFLVQAHNYSWYACGDHSEIRSGKHSAYEWKDVTCPHCLKEAPDFIKQERGIPVEH